jgi:predicted TIM-barrel fold metal-dependent hydrolase
MNDYVASIRDTNPDRFGFFVNLPDISLDPQASLEEIAYGLDVLKADGVTLFTRYGDGNAYLGHPSIEPIWRELNKRKAVVFIHPTHPADTTPVNLRLPQPFVDYPHETTRAAMDMLTMETRRKFPDCAAILSHAGGTLPYLIGRVTAGENALAGRWLADFRSFHFDLALASSPQVVELLRKVVPDEHILYGVSSQPRGHVVDYP